MVNRLAGVLDTIDRENLVTVQTRLDSQFGGRAHFIFRRSKAGKGLLAEVKCKDRSVIAQTAAEALPKLREAVRDDGLPLVEIIFRTIDET